MSKPVSSTVRSILASLTVSAAVLYACRADAQAVERFDLPVQPLAESLKAIGLQTKINVMAPPRLLEGLTAPAVAGEMTTDQAMARLLGSTGLEYYFVNDRTVVIRRKGDSPSAANPAGADDIHLAQAGDAPPDDLEEVVIRGVEFRYPDVQSASKMPMAVKDTPQSVKVVTQDLIEFAGIGEFSDIYKIDASTGTAHTGDHYLRQYYRGFTGNSSGNGLKVDGFRASSEVSLDLATFERFELVKGSTSTLYGQNAIGGTMNAISKMPRAQFGGEARMELGSFEHYRADADFYGPLGDSGDFSYRLIGAWQNAGSYIDFARDDRVVIAPTVQYSPSDSTSIIARVNHQRFDFSPYFGFGAQYRGGDPANGDSFRIPDVPRSRSGNAPTNDALKEVTIGQLILEQRVGTWKLRGSAQYEWTEARNNGMLLFTTDPQGFTDSLAYDREVDEHAYSGEVNLFGDVEWLGRSHTLFLGADLSSNDWHLFSRSAAYVAGVDSGFSILDPDYALLDIPATPEDYPDLYRQRTRHRQSGVTAQALIRPADRLTVSLGVRYSHDVLRSRWSCCTPADDFARDDPLKENAFTYQTGVTYALTPRLNVYATHGTTFEPQSGFVAAGSPVDPQEGIANEVGLKGDVPERKLSYSLAAFHMERTNITQDAPGGNFVLPIGTQRSQGVEVDIQGEIVRGWEIYGSLAWLDAEYVAGEFKGVHPANAPKFGASLFTSYEFQEGALRGLGFGGGVVHKSGLKTRDLASFGFGTPIDFVNEFTEVELRAFYSLRSWQLELAASNLLGERYYTNTFERLNLGFQVNPARQLMANVRYRF